MVKVVVRKGMKVYETGKESAQEKYDRLWLEKYKILLEFQNKFGHQRFPFDETSPNYTLEYVRLERWAVWQRIKYRRGKLSDWCYDMLVKAGFLFEPLETYWNQNYEKLLEFKETNGHTNVSKFDKDNMQLGKWVGEQRYWKKRLSTERIKKLDDIGFDWGIKRNKWDEMYEWLKTYYLKNGKAYVQRDMSNGYSGTELNRLNRWCGKQVWYYRRGKLPPDRIKLLLEIDFDFNLLESILIDNWETNFEKLIKFHERFGHYNVPVRWEEDKLLASWVQRTRVRKKLLSRDRISKLDEIGFTWDYWEDNWEKHFEELKAFKEKHGTCNVYPSQDNKLYYWIRQIRKIRRGYFDYQLTEDRIQKLDEIGFVWNPRDVFWEDCFDKLVEFKKQNGHCRVKYLPETKTLYLWCRTTRYNKQTLSKEKIDRLDEIGFVWDVSNKKN